MRETSLLGCGDLDVTFIIYRLESRFSDFITVRRAMQTYVTNGYDRNYKAVTIVSIGGSDGYALAGSDCNDNNNDDGCY